MADTPEPWTTRPGTFWIGNVGSNIGDPGIWSAYKVPDGVAFPFGEKKDDAHRIVACVNACVGIGTQDLGHGLFSKVRRILVRCQLPIGHLATEEARRNLQRVRSGLPMDHHHQDLQKALDDVLADLGGRP